MGHVVGAGLRERRRSLARSTAQCCRSPERPGGPGEDGGLVAERGMARNQEGARVDCRKSFGPDTAMSKLETSWQQPRSSATPVADDPGCCQLVSSLLIAVSGPNDLRQSTRAPS